MNLKEFQAEHRKWAKHNFGDRATWMPYVGMAEEQGEMNEALLNLAVASIGSIKIGNVMHWLLKSNQNIRGTKEELEAHVKDAIADQLVFLADVCNGKGWDLEELLEETWNEVKKRDWKLYPLNGLTK